MKTYCKKVKLDLDFVEKCTFEFLKGDSKRANKWSRRDYQKLISQVNNIPRKEVSKIVQIRDLEILKQWSDNIAKVVYRKISKLQNGESLDLPPIKYFIKHDELSGKQRECVLMQPIHQIVEFVAKQGLQELFSTKIEYYQCASVRGKGQLFGKQAIEKWVRRKGIKYYAKLDIVKCFPNIKTDDVVSRLQRDIGKNKELLLLVKELLNQYRGHLEIGTVLSADLCNYMLSDSFRYSKQIHYTRRNKLFKSINATLYYLDDLFFGGKNKKQLDKAIEQIIEFLHNTLSLKFHDYIINPISKAIDMMGYVIHYGYTTIRFRIFKRAKHHYIKAFNWLKHNTFLNIRRVKKLIAYYGYFKYSNSQRVRKKLHIDYLFNQAKKSVSHYEKKGNENVTSLFFN